MNLLKLGMMFGVWAAVRTWRPKRAVQAGALTAALLWVPPLAVVGVGAFALSGRWRRLRQQRRLERAADGDVGVLGELVLLGIRAGLTFVGSLKAAASHLATPLRVEVEAVVRRSRQKGSVESLVTAEGRGSELYALGARAVLSGGSAVTAVRLFVDEQRADERAKALADARKLPVRLLFPLALLILPGFMVLTVGPAVLTAVQRLTS